VRLAQSLQDLGKLDPFRRVVYPTLAHYLLDSGWTFLRRTEDGFLAYELDDLERVSDNEKERKMQSMHDKTSTFEKRAKST